MFTNAVPGQEDGPTAPDNWKRAVYRPAPSRFAVEVLPPVKLGGNYNFRMRICPLSRSDRSSVSSRGSNTEYEILRRWEDCLIFQETLEREYGRLAMSKRQRLIQGKGVRKNGIYLQSDRASSWESLPPGPEPDSVAKSIHDLIPRLTKRGTMFRASQATVDQRQAEITAFIAALWQDDVPTLLDDFRRDRTVTDFFGFWRRDQDIEKKNALNKPASPTKATRSSVTSSVFSSYFSASGDSRVRRARADSSASDSSSVPSTGSARSSISVQINEDQPLGFGHNPTEAPRNDIIAAAAKKLAKSEQMERPDSRASNATTIMRGPRESWMTTASGMSFVNDLGLTLPEDDAEDEGFELSSRMSMASIATFRTDISSEGVVPRYYIPTEPNLARMSTATFMTDVSAEGILPRPDSVFSDTDSVPDSHFYDTFPRPSSYVPSQPELRRPATPSSKLPLPSSPPPITVRTTARSASPSALSSLSLSPSSCHIRERPSSPSPSVTTTNSTIAPSLYSFHSAYSHLSTTTTSSLPPLAIKAVHQNAIILLRVEEEDVGLEEVRARLRDKFQTQEGVELGDKFKMEYIIPASLTKASKSTEGAIIETEEEWARLRASLDGAKLTLRVMDASA
ncbi:hypothetical protein MKEN_00425000 [Mycena kentingensis (nom. inval.)]|nr:hypothetical protein MKEN_00425000 [Mycena kentingensis (nom. inval.)]